MRSLAAQGIEAGGVTKVAGFGVGSRIEPKSYKYSMISIDYDKMLSWNRRVGCWAGGTLGLGGGMELSGLTCCPRGNNAATAAGSLHSIAERAISARPLVER